MMKSIFAFLFLMIIFTSGIKSQNCVYKTNEIDKFLKVKKLETNPVRFYNMFHGIDLSLKNIDGNKFLVV